MTWNPNALITYISERRNGDGGYAFAPEHFGSEFPSGLPDTYHCLSVLRMLGDPVPAPEEVSAYLNRILSESDKPGVSTLFYLYESHRILGHELEMHRFDHGLASSLRGWARERQEAMGDWFSSDYDAVDSPFQQLCYCAHLFRRTRPELFDGVDFSQNRDGGFGIGQSDAISTAFAISTAKALGKGFAEGRAASFLASCLCPSGGFAIKPEMEPPFVEPTFYSAWSLRMLGRPVPAATAKFAANLQSVSGGFFRSPFGGITSPAYCHYALGALEMAGQVRVQVGANSPLPARDDGGIEWLI